MAAVNSIVPQIKELADLPIRAGSGPTVFVRDIGTVENSSDILTGYALVNGRRTVYIPVTKRADAPRSMWSIASIRIAAHAVACP